MSNKSNKSGCGRQSEEVAGGVNVPFQRAHGDTWEPEEAPHLKELSERLRHSLRAVLSKVTPSALGPKALANTYFF